MSRPWPLMMVLGAGALLCACSGDDADEVCGNKYCGTGETCCGTRSCGVCVPRGSNTQCKLSCNDQGAAREVGSREAGGAKCGGTVCGTGSICCGPPACGHCVPENSGVYCPPQCPEAGPDR